MNRSVVLLAVALCLSIAVGAVTALSGRYSATGGDGRTVWRVDALTGHVSMCVARGLREPPQCTPWGSAQFAPAAAKQDEFDKLLDRPASSQ